MVTELKELDFGQARYVILKELDLKGPVGTILLRDQHELAEVVSTVVKTIESAMCPEIGLAGVTPMSDRTYRVLNHVSNTMPSYMLREPNTFAWGEFLNAWMILIDNYLNIQDTIVENLETPHPEMSVELRDRIANLRDGLSSIYRLVALGVSYADLINVTDRLVEEIRSWGNARPAALQLSSAYLEALNFYNKKE